MESNAQLYEAVLGLEPPWRVAEVQLRHTEQRVEVWLESESQQWPCPVCDTSCSRHDTKPRRWRHLDTCQFETILIASVPRVKCRQHGVKQVPVPWADAGSGFTAMFEQLVIRWLQEASITAVASLFGLSWARVDGIMQRAVRRGLKRRVIDRGRQLPEHIGIDETSFQKRHEYVTVICDQTSGFVEHVADGRTRAVVEEHLESFSEEARAGVKTVAMDMWQGYISAVEATIPEASTKICFDKFHMAQHLSRAVDQVRRAEHRQFAQAGESPLKRSRFLWLSQPATLSTARFGELERLMKVAKRTARAWAIKESGMDAWRYRSRH